jgi:hypothetical protein
MATRNNQLTAKPSPKNNAISKNTTITNAMNRTSSVRSRTRVPEVEAPKRRLDPEAVGYATATTPDAITLTLPCERRFFQTARLVVAGLATRLSLPYEQMDDLQLAVETVLQKHCDADMRATVELVVEPDALRIRVGPVSSSALEADEDELDTRRLLSALVERVEIVEDGGREWLRLEDGIRAG